MALSAHQVVILSKRFLRREGSGRAARCVASFATQYSRVWLASLLLARRVPHFSRPLREVGIYPKARYFRAPAVSRTPASLANFAALSVNSQVKSGSLRPKCP